MRVATALYGLFSTKCRNNTVLLRVGLFESCDGFIRFFFSTQCRTNTVLLWVGLQYSFDLTLFLRSSRVKTIFY